MPICSICNIDKPQESFGVYAKAGTSNYKITRKNGDLSTPVVYKKWCKECDAKKQKAYRDAHPNLWKKYAKSNSTGKFRKIPKEDKFLISAIRTKITEAKANNKRHPNRAFNIDADYMYALWKEQQGTCYLTGVQLITAKQKPNSLSIDKIKPELGYVKGNVKWACWAANRAKGEMSIETLLDMCKCILEKCRDYRTDTLVNLEE